MTREQREQNPDVNSYSPDPDSGGGPPTGQSDREDDVIPVPPDSHPGVPVEEPPETQGVPVGDVDDSPKRIT